MLPLRQVGRLPAGHPAHRPNTGLQTLKADRANKPRQCRPVVGNRDGNESVPAFRKKPRLPRFSRTVPPVVSCFPTPREQGPSSAAPPNPEKPPRQSAYPSRREHRNQPQPPPAQPLAAKLWSAFGSFLHP